MKPFFLYLCILTAALFVSCSTARRMNAVRNSLSEMRSAGITDSARIAKLEAASDSRYQEGKIDSVLGFRIKSKLKVFEDSFFYYRKKEDSLYALLKRKKEFKEKYRSWVLPAMDSLKRNYERYKDRLAMYVLIEDGLNIANYHLFDMAAFFGPGKFTIPAEKEDSAMLAFSPLIDSLIAFSDKYKGRKRVASLVILGFADATGYSGKSLLADSLSALLGNSTVTRELLNKKLSELRAEEVCRQLARLYYRKSATVKNNGELRLEYNYQGKGESFPLLHIKDYTTNDHRRRIVLCYWAVLPE